MDYACVPCVALFTVATDAGRPDLVVRHCPYCGGEVIPPKPLDLRPETERNDALPKRP